MSQCFRAPSVALQGSTRQAASAQHALVIGRAGQVAERRFRQRYRLPPYTVCMTHTVRQKTKLLNRVRRIRGLVDAIERALENEADCEHVMHVIAACRGAMSGLLSEVVEDHIQTHLIDPLEGHQAESAQAAEQLIDVLRRYFK
jgi:DNA-binding FrmR family transcriptional regulator